VPEGHTLHRLARQLDERFAGRPVAVSSPQGRFEAGAALVDGRRLDEVSAYGKHLFASFGDLVVHVHLGLYGKVSEGSAPAPAPWGALRMRWTNEDWWSDLRGATACEVVTHDEAAAIVARLGPDPLARRPDGARAWRRISRSRAQIGVLLMDQSVIAGVGNVYRAEVLFRQRRSPFDEGRTLSEEEWQLLWADIVGLMRDGVRRGWIVTTRAEDRRRGRVRGEDAHYVYRRAGLACRICGTPVAASVMAVRNLFWCPTCQRP